MRGEAAAFGGAGVKRNKRQARVYTSGTAEETPNGQRRLRLASATNAAVPAYVELGLPLHTYHLPHWRRTSSCARARARMHRSPFPNLSAIRLVYLGKERGKFLTAKFRLNSRRRWEEGVCSREKREEKGRKSGRGEWRE